MTPEWPVIGDRPRQEDESLTPLLQGGANPRGITDILEPPAESGHAGTSPVTVSLCGLFPALLAPLP